MKHLEDEYAFLTMAYSDVEHDLIKTFLEANGIPVVTREKGFGGPIRSIYMGSMMPANIEIFVAADQLDQASLLLETDFSGLAESVFDGDDDA